MWTRRSQALKWLRRRARSAAAPAFLFLVAMADPGAALAATAGEECDRLAAYESSFATKDVSYDELDAEAAIRACGAAVANGPGQPRHRFLLSRALFKAKRYAESRREAERALKDGVANANIILGRMYKNGIGVGIDLTAARGYFRAASLAGLTEGQVVHALMLERGEGGAKDEAEAARWMKRAAVADDLDAAVHLARYLSEGKGVAQDHAAAAGWARRAAARGVAKGQFLLGQFYESGTGVAKDPWAAKTWYRMAADRGSAEAARALSALERRLPGERPAPSEATLRTARAAATEGRRHVLGEGVAVDIVRGRGLIERAAEAGDSLGEYVLAWLYEQGLGVEADAAKAAAAYENGAGRGELAPTIALGKLLTWGGHNLHPDYDRALQLLTWAEADSGRQANLSPSLTVDLNENLAILRARRGEYIEAEAILVRTLDIAKRASPKSAMPELRVLRALAFCYEESGRSVEVDPLLARAMVLLESTRRPNDSEAAGILLFFAVLKEFQGEYATAADLYRRARRLETNADTPVASVVPYDVQIARVLVKSGKYAEADALLAPLLDRIDRAGGANEPYAIRAAAEEAFVLGRLGKRAQSEALYGKVAARLTAAGIAVDSTAVEESAGYAEVVRRFGRTEEALGAFRQVSARDAARLDSLGSASRAERARAGRAMRDGFLRHVAILERELGRAPNGTYVSESFEVVQLANAASASESIGGAAARLAAGSEVLNALARERQRIVENWRRLDRQLPSAVLQDGERRGQMTAQLDEMRALEEALGRLDGEIRREFPAFFAYTRNAPVPLRDAQALLMPDEALVTYVLGRDDAFAMALTAKAAVLRRLDGITVQTVERDIAAVRRTLDPSDAASASDLKPVDLARLHALYRQLLAPLGLDLGAIRHILVVPDGPLSALPFHVLVTEPPPAAPGDFAGYRKVGWLARKAAVTVVPSVASLRALRATVPARAPTKPFVGFGDPVFGADASGAVRGAKGIRRGLPARAVAKRGSVDLAALRGLPPLPDTAEELARIAKLFRADGEVFLQAEASERRVKTMDLSQYGILALATHGLIAGELNGLDEPALVLTVPAQASAEDDGLLTASEVALLNLNADWVVLSACNTASGDGRPGADGLSGLARAFFIAGSRALLVSNWPVLSDAAAEVTTRMFERMRADGALRRSEALRLAMLALLDDGRAPDYMAHPAAWAPFVVVGDGAALRSR